MAKQNYPNLRFFINGTWAGYSVRDTIEVVDPSCGEILGALPCATAQDVEQAIAAAARSFATWRNTPPLERARYLRTAAELLRDRRERWAGLIALELGKPFAEALRETDVACEMLDWAAEEARRIYGRLIPGRVANMRMMAFHEPVGPVGAISGWNAPAITPARKIAAALGAGCTLVLKASEATPACALELARAFDDAGLPAGVLNIIFGDPPQIADVMATHPDIRMLSFTGGTTVGKELASKAAASLKRGVYELGGHAPVLIFADSDIEAVGKAAATAKFRNSGQVCTSPTRFLVEQPAFERFVAAFAAAAGQIRIGDPFDPETQMGPLQNARRRDAIASLIDDAVASGAKVETGGETVAGPGFFFRPTVLTGVSGTARISREEPFGAVALVRPFNSIDEAIAEANRLPFGLAAYAFTSELAVTERLARELQCGTLAVNHWAASFPETPFGGVKDSGIGSEGGSEGVTAFCQTRFVSIQA